MPIFKWTKCRGGIILSDWEKTPWWQFWRPAYRRQVLSHDLDIHYQYANPEDFLLM